MEKESVDEMVEKGEGAAAKQENEQTDSKGEEGQAEQQDKEVDELDVGEEEEDEEEDEEREYPFFTTLARSVKVTAGGRTEAFHVHQAVLDCFSKLDSQTACSSQETEEPPLRVELPGSAELAHFVQVLDFLYRTPNVILFESLVDAIHASRVATALGCHETDVQLINAALRGMVRADEDLDLALRFLKNEELPAELHVFAQRLPEQGTKQVPVAPPEATPIEARCMYMTQIKRVQVVAEQRNESFFVHADILDRSSYFASHQARWNGTGECPKVLLPEGASLDHFGKILEHLYNPLQWVSFDNVRDAIQVNRVATMLSCDSQSLAVFKAALRITLKTDEDVALLRQLCEEEELPVEIQPIARRATKQRKCDEVSVDELRIMHSYAMQVNNSETLEYVAEHLKRRSRRGGAATNQVKAALKELLENDLICGSQSTSSVSLVIEFLAVHPQYYSEFAALWNPDLFEDAHSIDMLNLAFKHFSCESIREDDMIGYIVHLIACDTGEAALKSIAAVLGKLGAAIQLLLLKRAMPMEGDRLSCEAEHAAITFSRLPIAQALSLEAKAVLVERIVLLEDEDVAKIAKAPLVRTLGQTISMRLCDRVLTMSPALVERLLTAKFLDAVGGAGTRKLLPVACVLQSERSASLKQRILTSVQADISDDSESGF